MKPTFRRASRLYPSLAAAMAALLAAPSAHALNFWWDINGTTTTGAAATGTWLAGSAANWTTVAAGNLATSAVTTTSADDLFFAAAGMTAATITLNTTESARSVSFSANQAFVISGSGTINLGSATGTSGISTTVAAAQTINNSIVLNSGATAIAISNIATTATSGLITLGGTITGSAASGTQTITARSTNTSGITLSNAISDGAGGGKVALIVNSLTGTTTLSGTNTYTGNTLVNAGALQFTTQASLYNNGSAAAWSKNNFVVNSGGTAIFNMGGAGQFTDANINTLLGLSDSASNGFRSRSALGLDTTGGNVLYSSAIANPNSGNNLLHFTKLGVNTLTLEQDNTYTGRTFISAGTLQLGSGGTTGRLSTSSAIVNNGTLTINRSDAVAQGTDFSAAPIIGTGALIQAGAGTTTLSAANTFTGTTTVSGGKIILTNALALQNSAYVTTGSNGTTIGLDVTGALSSGNLTLGGLSGAVDLAGAFTAGFTNSVTNLTLNPQGAQSNTYSGIIANGAMTLTKTGTGTQILAGANTYTGATTIREGTLTVGNGLTGSLSGITGTALTFTGTGTFNVAEAADSTQGMGALTLSAGDATVSSTAAGATSAATLTFASLATRPAGATGNLSLAVNSTSTGSTPNRIVFTDTTNVPLAGGSNNPGLFFGGANYARYDAAGFARAVIYGSTDTNANASLTGTAVTTLGAIDATKDSQFVGAAAATTNGTAQAAGLTTMTVANGDAFKVGQVITGAGITANTFVTGISVNVLTLSQAAGAITATAYTPYNSVSAQTTGTVNTVNLSGTGASLTLVSGATLSVNGILKSGAGNLGVISGGAGIQTVSSGGEMVVRPNLSTDVLTIATPILNNGGSSLTKSGAGTLLLSAANTYAGGTVLNGGTVVISNAGSFGATTGAVTVNGSSRINAADAITIANPIIVNAGRTLTLAVPTTVANSVLTATFSGVLSGSGDLFLPNNGGNGAQGILAFTNTANTFSGNVVLSASSAGNEHFQFNSLGDAGNFTFAKNGNRQLITYSGSSNITFNTRQIVIAETMVNGGTTDRQGMDGNGSNPVSMFANDGPGTVSFTKDMVVNNISNSYGVLYFGGTNAGDNTFSGNISDTIGTSKLAIGKFGTGTWILSGTNTFEGNILIAGGTLSVGTIANATVPQPLGIGPAIQLGVGGSGANGILSYTGGTTSTDKQVQIGATTAAGSTGGGSILNNGTGALAFTNPTFNPATTGVTGNRTLTLGGSYTGSANEVQGVIQNNTTAGSTGVVSLAKSGAGTWVLSGKSTYTGTTTVNGGMLQMGIANAISGSTVTVNSTTAAATARFNLNGFGVTVPGLTFGGTGATATSSNEVIGTGAGSILTLNGNATYADTDNPLGATISTTTLDLNNGARTFAIGDSTSTTAELSVSSTIQNGALTKSGAGTMVLSGANSYTGATGVTAGALAVNGLLANTTTTVSGTGTLKGSGSIAGSVTINSGGTLDSGTSIESLATGALSFTNLATFQYELNKDAAAAVAGDLTVVTGNLGLSDTVTLALIESGSGAWELGVPLGDPLGSPAADKLTLIGFTGSWNGGLFTYLGSPVLDDSAITLNGQQWWFNYNDTLPGTNFTGDLLGGMTYVTMTVPEPGAALLGSLGLLALLRRRR